jgi:thiol-disulfide isomerase/thioredoxin
MFRAACAAAMLLACVAIGRAASEPTEAEAWAKIGAIKATKLQPPSRGADGKIPREQLVAYRQKLMGQMLQLMESSNAFAKRFSKSPHAAAALELAAMTSSQLAGAAGAQFDSARAIVSELAKRDDLPSTAALYVSNGRLRVLQQSTDKSLSKADNLKEQRAVAEAFHKKYPTNANAGILFYRVGNYAQNVDADMATEMFKMAKAIGPVELQRMAEARLSRIKTTETTPATETTEATSTTPDIKFTAIDGREVDLAKLKGKVVLVDFWATWCGPCVGEIPNVKKTYETYHDKGFEIVGISLDSDRAALETFVKEHGMSWPQYFDGKGWKNAISTRFGINAIPATWLIDKDGNVATTNARENLAEKVNALLTTGKL